MSEATYPEIVVYGTSWCPDCRHTENFLRSHGIPFRYHDAEAALAARDAFDRVHRLKEAPDEMETVQLAPGEDGSLWLAYALVGGGLADSTSEARRLIAQGGIRVDGDTLADTGCHLPRGSYVVQRGKRRFVRIEIDVEGPRPTGDGPGNDGG